MTSPDDLNTAVDAVYGGLKTAVSTGDVAIGYIRIMDVLMGENVKLRASLKRRAELPLRKQIEAKEKQMETMEEQFKFQLTSLNEKHISMVSSYAGVVKEQQDKINELIEKLNAAQRPYAKGSAASTSRVIMVPKKGLTGREVAVEMELVEEGDYAE
jgi:uncharacterized coiled-coil protein SlyX